MWISMRWRGIIRSVLLRSSSSCASVSRGRWTLWSPSWHSLLLLMVHVTRCGRLVVLLVCLLWTELLLCRCMLLLQCCGVHVWCPLTGAGRYAIGSHRCPTSVRVLRVFVEYVRGSGVLRDAIHYLAGHLKPGGQARRKGRREIYGHSRAGAQQCFIICPSSAADWCRCTSRQIRSDCHRLDATRGVVRIYF